MFAILKKHSPKLTEDSFEFQLKYLSDDTDYTVFAVWQILLNIVHPFLMEMHVFFLRLNCKNCLSNECK